MKPIYDSSPRNQFIILEHKDFEESLEQKKIRDLNDFFIIIHSNENQKEHYVGKDGEMTLYRSIYCLYPGQISFFDTDTVCRGAIILFKPEFISPLRDEITAMLSAGLFNIYSTEIVRMEEEKAAELDRFVAAMLTEFNEHAELQTEILNALFKLFIMHLIRNNKKTQPDNPSANGDLYLVNRFFDLVNKHFVNWKKVTDYANQLCIVPNYLNIKVKKVTGSTASYHIQQRIILEAKRRAKRDYMSLKEIAYALGYDDISHFSKFFKKFAGVSFSDFKKIPV